MVKLNLAMNTMMLWGLNGKLEVVRRNTKVKKYQCPCCGYFTYHVPANEDCGYICPVCFWENDPFITFDSEPSDSNHGMTLKEAKDNFLQFGACDKEMLCHVRKPRDNETEKG